MNDLSFARTWLPFIYLYVAGGIIFFGGILLIFKAKSIKIRRATHKKWFIVLLFGYFYYLALHGILTLAALYL